jgi:hypothetical protein
MNPQETYDHTGFDCEDDMQKFCQESTHPQYIGLLRHKLLNLSRLQWGLSGPVRAGHGPEELSIMISPANLS